MGPAHYGPQARPGPLPEFVKFYWHEASVARPRVASVAVTLQRQAEPRDTGQPTKPRSLSGPLRTCLLALD